MKLSPTALIQHMRTTAGENALKNLDPIVLAVDLAPGVHPDDPDLFYKPSLTVGPAVQPLLAAFMDHHHATQRGRATWQIGYGEDTPSAAVGALLDHARPGTVWWKGDMVSGRANAKALDLNKTTTRPSGNHWNFAQRRLPWEFTAARIAAHNLTNLYREEGRLRAGKFGQIALNDTGNSLFISVHTTQFLELPEMLALELGTTPLHQWQVGRGFRDPVRVYPAQALAIAEWAMSVGLQVLDPSETGILQRFREIANRSVVAWPRKGRPAQATVSVGVNVPATVREALSVSQARVVQHAASGRSSVMSTTNSVALADSLSGLAAGAQLIAPAVLDAAALAVAQPVDDERLRPYQRIAVGMHLATSIGYVNACSPGLGKTVMVLDAMRRRALNISSYRALVVAEANVRQQWCKEAEVWFPTATTVRVDSRSDVAKLQQTLDEAGPFPVIVVTSYALASDVMLYVDDVHDAELDAVEADITEEVDAQEAAAPVVEAPVVTAPVVKASPRKAPVLPAPEGEPEDLLQLLALLLEVDAAAALAPASEPADADDDADEALRLGLGQVLLSQHWHDIVADEAVTLRSTSSKQSKAMWALRAQSDVAVALTGTPINRGINDLGALMSWVRNDRRLFHGAQLEKTFDLSDDEQLADFASAMGALMFRRDKSEIQDEIPNVESQVMTLDPSPAEMALANAARNELKRAYDDLLSSLNEVAGHHVGSDEYAAAQAALTAARHAWLGGTTLARMAASDPAALLTAKGAGAALLASQGLVAAATTVPGTKRTSVVADTVDRVMRGERLLIFTEFASVARGLIEDLDASGIRVGAVVGGGGKKRDRDVIAFREGELDVLVCTSAGEKGLNLQTATTIVHYDLPWTPEGIIQRSGRVERIGATAAKIKIVFWAMAGTIEERVASVVVARAAMMMRALDTSRGADARTSDVGRALGSLADTAKDSEVTKKEAALLQITRELLAA